MIQQASTKVDAGASENFTLLMSRIETGCAAGMTAQPGRADGFARSCGEIGTPVVSKK
jgi:hypothetical protein